jgi:hypothetical protein
MARRLGARERATTAQHYERRIVPLPDGLRRAACQSSAPIEQSLEDVEVGAGGLSCSLDAVVADKRLGVGLRSSSVGQLLSDERRTALTLSRACLSPRSGVLLERP